MPRITHVARAQQRFETKPVLNENGEQIMKAVFTAEGVAKVTKSGRQVFMSRTVRDLAKPLPPLVCTACQQDILPGTPYKHMSPKSGPYGGNQLSRHEGCPDWQPWDYSNSLSARLAKIAYDFNLSLPNCEFTDDVQDALNSAAEAVREIAQEKEDSAQNMEDGFQHETEQSQTLREIVESLNTWADEIDGADIPEFPEPEDTDCEDCGREGTVDEKDCETCDGTGQITPEEPTEEQIEDWHSELSDTLTVVEEVPV